FRAGDLPGQHPASLREPLDAVAGDGPTEARVHDAAAFWVRPGPYRLVPRGAEAGVGSAPQPWSAGEPEGRVALPVGNGRFSVPAAACAASAGCRAVIAVARAPLVSA